MASILCRTIIVYLFLTVIMRLLGKRQLGELQLSELITTLLLSELAAIPITDPNIPILYGLVPVAFIFALEIIIPSLFFRFPALRKWVEGTPAFLIRDGRIVQSELKKNRITPEEFLAVLRTNKVSDPAEVKFAILEASGAISIFLMPDKEQPTRAELSVPAPDSGIAHILVADGRYNRSELEQTGRSQDEIEKLLHRKHLRLKHIYLLTVDDQGQYSIIKKESKK